MIRQELVRELATKLEVSMVKVDSFLDALTETVTDEIAKGGFVKISGFGKWEIVDRAEREGRNPSTGDKMIIPAKKAVKFKVGKELKESVKA